MVPNGDNRASDGPRRPDSPPPQPGPFHTKAECEKKALEIVKENTLPGQVTTYSCVQEQ